VFACVVLFPLARRPQWNWRLVPMMLCFAAMNYSYLTSMMVGSAANTIWLQMCAPVWVLLAGVMFFGERTVPRDWWLLGFVMTGLAIILYYESQGEATTAVGWGLLSGITYAGVVLSLRNLRSLDSAWLAALNHAATVLCLLPFALGDSPRPHGIQWGLLAAFGMLQMGLPYVLFARGLRHIPGHEATAIGMIEPLLMPLWVWLAWGEQPAWWTIVGGGFILTGLCVRYLSQPAPPRVDETASPALDPESAEGNIPPLGST